MHMDANELLKGDISIASLPDIYSRLEEAIDAPDTSFEHIGALISSDPALAARMLRLANSALFKTRNPVDSIYTAVSVIGTKQLRDLVLATIVIDKFDGIDQDRLNMEDFWRHSIACGIAARVIATYQREPNVERYYLMGLFHDMGRILLLSKIPDEETAVLIKADQQDCLLQPLEQEMLGFDHADISAQLLKMWNLPEIQQEAVHYHHAPQEAPNENAAASLVHVADWIAHGLNYGTSGEKYVPPLDEAAWEALHIPTSALDTIIKHIDEQYQSTVNLFLKGH
ncbi:MAG: phosphohydrolase [Moraxellaceae bacterium]|nr:MAG: phosphohydrolase [Moraxellaceae bacterium]